MESANARLRIAVLAGGDSSERAVSLESGRCVQRALNQAGHSATRFDPTTMPLASIDWTTFDACFIALHGGAGEDGRIQQQLQELGVRELMPSSFLQPHVERLGQARQTQLSQDG